MDTSILIYGIPAAVLTVGITEVIKRIGISQRFIPLVSVITGAIVVSVGTLTLSIESVVIGVIIGLTSSGIWDVTKISVLGK